jgi:hypothetical protein
MKFLIVQLPPFSRHLNPLRSKYSSQDPILLRVEIMEVLHNERMKKRDYSEDLDVDGRIMLTWIIGIGLTGFILFMTRT